MYTPMTSHGIPPAQRPIREDALDLPNGAETDSPVPGKLRALLVLDPQAFESVRPRKGFGRAVGAFATNVAEDISLPSKTVRTNRDRLGKMKLGR